MLVIFDLDNTLYPPSQYIMNQISQRIGLYIQQYLNLSPMEAKKIQKQYFHEFGSSMKGMMEYHQIDPYDYMDFVHRLDYEKLRPNAELIEAIQALKGKKYIHTNASKAHAMNVLGRLNMQNLFDGIFDIADGDFIPKPHLSNFQAIIKRFGLEPNHCLMVEDLAHNLEKPAKLGMTTLLYKEDSPQAVYAGYHDQDIQNYADYIHYSCGDLAKFLNERRA